jgi:hypothetical protein
MKKWVCTLIIVLLSPTLCQALCLKGDCKNGQGRMKSPDGRVYEGEFKHGYLWAVAPCAFRTGAAIQVILSVVAIMAREI